MESYTWIIAVRPIAYRYILSFALLYIVIIIVPVRNFGNFCMTVHTGTYLHVQGYKHRQISKVHTSMYEILSMEIDSLSLYMAVQAGI
jgi:hypothetical protein